MVIIKVYGKVQGVFFRQSTKRLADELGIKGFVQNQADGSVYVEACGQQAALDQFIAWCQVGPDAAQVQRLEVEVAYDKCTAQKFEIRPEA